MTYAYSTARACVNMALELAGVQPIASDADYINPARTDKYQRQAVLWFDIIQRKLAITMNKRFNIRKFTFSTTAGQESYTLPTAMVEGFKANSFVNITASGHYNGSLGVMTYEQWRTSYPRPDLAATGPPQYIVPLPDDGSGNTKVMVWPYADRVYTIEGLCRVVAMPVTSGSSFVIFPQCYEHALILKLKEMIEGGMNEGRQINAMVLADEAVAEVMRDASGAYEEVDPIDFGVRLYSGRGGNSTRDYDPDSDVPGAYP